VQPEFWQERWREQRIGFHQQRPSPLLEAHWDAVAPPPGSRVLVPLCGKTLDMPWLAARGHRVLGVELSELAVRQFFDECGLTPARRTSRYGEHYAAGPFELICGDAFALDRALLDDCAGVFDRAALIALPADLRRRYRDTVYASLPGGCRGLLIALEYLQHEMDGPPFSLEADDVRAALDAHWTIDTLERRDMLAQEPAFVEAGVTRLHTVAYRLQRDADG
jgi:thiopurine S-methyltransferase